MIQTAIIIVNYKNANLTIRFVNEELKKLSSPYTVIVVNNESCITEDSFLAEKLNGQVIHDIFQQPSKSKCFIISSKKNLGFAKANNLAFDFAMRYIKPQYVLFSNNDIQIRDNDTLSLLIQTLESDSKIGIIGPMIKGLKGELQSPEPYRPFWDRYVWMFISTPFISKEKKTQRFMLDYPQKAKEGFHYKVMGSFFLMKAEDYFKCGQMDPNTFLYSEETILSERIKAIGKSVYYYPKTCVIHAHGATTKKIGNSKINKYKVRSECYYYRKYMKEPLWKLWIGTIIHEIILSVKK